MVVDVIVELCVDQAAAMVAEPVAGMAAERLLARESLEKSAWVLEAELLELLELQLPSLFFSLVALEGNQGCKLVQ
jgi:hypothetical protein